MASEVSATATTMPPALELAWSPSTMTVLTLMRLWRKACCRRRGKYPETVFKDSNKRWAEKWFMVANLAPGLPPRTGFPPVLNARWEEKPTKEEMVEVEVLLAELQKLKADKLTGAAVALSFAKRLTQPIQERVHPGYEYSGREDLTRGQNRKVLRNEAYKWVMLIVSREVRDKGCLKAYCLKWTTTEEKVVSFWCPAPLPDGQQGKTIDLPAGLALLAVDVGSFSFDSSIRSESDDVVEVSGPAASAGSTTKKRRPTRKMAALKPQKGGVAPQGRSSTPPGLTTPKPEEEDQEEERGQPTRSPTRVAQSLPSAVPLKTSFSVRRTERRVSLSGAKRKAVSTHDANSAEVAKGEVSPIERLLARPRLIEVAAAKAEEAKEEAVASELPQGDNHPSEEKASGEEAVVTKDALLEAAQRAAEATQALADLSRRARSQLKAGDGLASRVLQLEEELRALKRHHSEASKKQSAKLKGADALGFAQLKEANEMMARELKVVVAVNDELHQLRGGTEGRESLMEEKLRLEKQRYKAFEPEGVALAEEAARRLDAARECLKAFIMKTAKDSV
ncbi:hypothetical protein C2845_PMPSC055854 [Panicum miliaceum]|uniref:Uncharacterized protein n=1 Tax=Panicum miliaceum TaxID=4540 RepID=A0A3L6P9A0_PANMI|nr:hypothetical protein C2845_PMPSC055854 [Panicum miliaceum]